MLRHEKKLEKQYFIIKDQRDLNTPLLRYGFTWKATEINVLEADSCTYI
jgi:hypothetical protein